MTIPANPVLKPSVEVLEASDGDIYLLRPHGADVALRAPTPQARALIRALRDHRPVGDRSSLAPLAAAGLLTGSGTSSLLTGRQRRRYDRQLHYFADALPAGVPREEAQVRLLESSVAVLGVGGLGTWAAAALAQSGVGHLILVDDDDVDDSNLNRQVLFAESDLGRPKVDAAARRLEALNDEIRITALHARLTSARDVAFAIAGADVVIATADQPTDKIATWIDDGCRAAGVPHVSAGQFPPKLRVGPFVIPGKTPGICCLYEQLRADEPLFDELMALRASQRSVAATLAGASAVIGGLLATEVLHHLTGIAQPATIGRSMTFDLTTFAADSHALPTQRCRRCASAGSR